MKKTFKNQIESFRAINKINYGVTYDIDAVTKLDTKIFKKEAEIKQEQVAERNIKLIKMIKYLYINIDKFNDIIKNKRNINNETARVFKTNQKSENIHELNIFLNDLFNVHNQFNNHHAKHIFKLYSDFQSKFLYLYNEFTTTYAIDYFLEKDKDSEYDTLNSNEVTDVKPTTIIYINDEQLDNFKAMNLDKINYFNENKLKIFKRSDKDLFNVSKSFRQDKDKKDDHQNKSPVDLRNQKITVQELLNKILSTKKKVSSEVKYDYRLNTQIKIEMAKYTSENVKLSEKPPIFRKNNKLKSDKIAMDLEIFDNNDLDEYNEMDENNVNKVNNDNNTVIDKVKDNNNITNNDSNKTKRINGKKLNNKPVDITKNVNNAMLLKGIIPKTKLLNNKISNKMLDKVNLSNLSSNEANILNSIINVNNQNNLNNQNNQNNLNDTQVSSDNQNLALLNELNTTNTNRNTRKNEKIDNDLMKKPEKTVELK